MTLGEKYNPWKSGKYAPIPEWLHRRKEVSHGAKSVMARLLRYAGKNGSCHPKQETLADEVGMTVRQLQRYVKELVMFKIISVERGSTKRGHRSSEYFFHRHEWQNSDTSKVTRVIRHFWSSSTTDMSCRSEQKTVDKSNEMKLIKNQNSLLRESRRESIKNRYNGKKQNDFYETFFKAMQESGDRIKTCDVFLKNTNGAEFEKVNTLYEVLSWLRGAGANDEIEKSWQWHWKIVCRLPRQVVWDGVIQGQLKEGVLLGKITNIGAAYAMAIKKVAAANGVDLETKRGMAKAAPVNKKIRKVA